MPSGTEVIVDGPADEPNPWRGYQRCLRNLGSASHVLVVQDDTVACRNIERVCEQLAAARPDTVTSLFVGGLRGRTERNYWRAMQAKRHWAQVDTQRIVHVVALLWPASLASEILSWAETTVIPGIRNPTRSDDEVVGAFVKLTKRPVWATVPCLVEHPDDVPSTVHKRQANGLDRGRVAMSWIGAEADPTAIDWSVV